MTDIITRLRQPMAWARVYGGTVTADTAPTEAADEIERLDEIIRETKPDTWSFDTLLYVGRRLLRDVYPEDIFTGESGDSGPQYVVALREAIARIDREDSK